ncbi:MAG: hypothetical protein HRT58_04430 [Crocinitomicaceae bacterium]|nr:hypothetical protein [Flavobacteriales bacterium]NQZ34883.1 hypothetical protein [Crocinitomicaceae bacterium]
MSTTNGELTKTVTAATGTSGFSIDLATVIKISYTKDGESFDLLVAGVQLVNGKFSRIDGVPTTLYLSNLVSWIGGVEKLSEFLPDGTLKNRVITKLTQLVALDVQLDLSDININVATMEIDFGVVIPGISITTAELGLPAINGLTFGLEEIILNVSRKVDSVPN